jgi:cytochrome c peroxidase
VIAVGVGLALLTLYRARLDTLATALERFDRVAATAGASDSGAVRSGFRDVRLAYKRVECLVEYVDPTEAAALNGPGVEGVDEAEDDPGEPDEASSLGLLRGAEQAIYRYPVLFTSTRARIAADIGGARVVVDQLRASARGDVNDVNVVGAARQEMVRVAALGLAGEDSRSARASLAEAAAALEGTRDVLASAGTLGQGQWAAAIDAGLAMVAADTSWTDFNRLRFIVAVVNPVVGSAWVERPRAGTATEIARGAALFRSPALSGTGTRSCATCHQPARGFTDGLARAAPLPSHAGAVLRHTPTLINVAFADAWFDDGRAASLEAQVTMVVGNPDEMGGRGPSRARARAIAAYERTLVRFNSRVDRALAGDTLALASTERHGFNVFMGKGACGTCHYLPLFNGTRPPRYAHTEYEVLGVADTDSGRARVTHDAIDLGAMKTPGLRFVEPGGPYMHNGAYRTLGEVVAFYDSGGARVANQTLSPEPLHLTDAETRDLVAFLEALRVVP